MILSGLPDTGDHIITNIEEDHHLIPHDTTNGNPGFELMVQEVWFVIIVSVFALVLLMAFLAAICVKRRSILMMSHSKSIGHYNGKYFIKNVPSLSCDDTICDILD